MRGATAHAEFEHKLFEDLIAVHQSLRWDVIRLPLRNLGGRRPGRQVDECTFVFEHPGGTHEVWRWDPAALWLVEIENTRPPVTVEDWPAKARRMCADMPQRLARIRENNAADSQISTAQLRVDGLSARYRRALEDRAALQRTLVAAIRQGGGQALDDDSLLFVAQWVDRRLRTDPQALASVQAAAGILRDLARRSAQAGTGVPSPQSAAPIMPQGATQNGAAGGAHVQTSPSLTLPAQTSPSQPSPALTSPGLTPPQSVPALPGQGAQGAAERAPAARMGQP